MTTIEYPRLCGGTFFTLVLQALRQRMKAREHYSGDSDGLSDPEVLVGLIKVINPDYTDPGKENLKGTANNYKACKISNSTYLPFDDEQVISAFDSKVKTAYQSVLNRMVGFVNDFLDMSETVHKDVNLIRAIVDLVQQDQTIKAGDEFFIGQNGEKKKKATLGDLKEVCLPSFLLGVWHFIEFQCRHIQITLDGIEETHNKRRISKNGEPTFHQIVENLLLLDKYYLKIAYVIRINVDRSNVADVEPLMQELRRYGIQHAKIDFGVVRAETEACQTYESNCFNDSELGSRLDQLWRLAEKYQFSRYPGLYRRFCYCGLYCDNSYTISPKGELYKCWEMVGDLKHRIGNICSSGSVDDVSFAYYDWMTIDPLDNDDCRSCVYLPLCGGGCVMNSVKSTGSYHSSGCFKVKGVVEQQVLYLVEKKKQLSASNPITVSN